MSSFQNAFAQAANLVRRSHGPTNPSQSTGLQRNSNLHENTTANAEPLLRGWEEQHTPGRGAYRVDRNTKPTTWMRPSTKKAIESRPLPPRWEEQHFPGRGAYRVDRNTKTKTWRRPLTKKVIESGPLPLGLEEWHAIKRRAWYIDHDTKSKTWVMSTPQILQRLYSLDTSSPDFLHHICCFIQYDEEEQYLASLQGSELAQLVGFLDKVRPVPSVFHRFTKPTPKALGAIRTTDDVARECLNKLQAICGHLPASYIASGQIARVGDGPVTLGVIADVWEGTYRSKKVSIKCLKIRMENYQALKEVRIQYGTSSSRLLKNTCGRCSHSAKGRSSGKG